MTAKSIRSFYTWDISDVMLRTKRTGEQVIVPLGDKYWLMQSMYPASSMLSVLLASFNSNFRVGCSYFCKCYRACRFAVRSYSAFVHHIRASHQDTRILWIAYVKEESASLRSCDPRYSWSLDLKSAVHLQCWGTGSEKEPGLMTVHYWLDTGRLDRTRVRMQRGLLNQKSSLFRSCCFYFVLSWAIELN